MNEEPVITLPEPEAAPVAAEPATAPEVVEEKVVEETPEERGDKAIKKMQRRIDMLTRRAYEAEARAKVVEQSTPKAEPTEPAQPTTQDQIFNEAKRLRELERIAEKANRVHAEVTKDFPDFFPRFIEMQAALGPMFDRQGHPTPLMDAILDSDAPAKVLNHVASDLDLASELSALSPHRLTRRLVQIETELAGKPKPSEAAKPLKPVTAKASQSDPDPDDTTGWIEARNRKLRAR